LIILQQTHVERVLNEYKKLAGIMGGVKLLSALKSNFRSAVRAWTDGNEFNWDV
jgi:hypothetical protein